MTNKQIWEQTKNNDWLDAMFHDNDSGEEFFVELKKEQDEDMEDFIAKCQEIADENFDDAEFLGLEDAETAELLGYDTY